jgi:predicted metal-dependent peptidase
MAFDLDRHAFRLLKDEPFFAAISRNVSKIQNRGVPTAGVMVNKTTHFFELHYNPDFFDNLGQTDFYGKELEGDARIERRDTEIRAILKHEFYHLIFNHLTERLPDGEMNMIWNVAADLAINSEIGVELPNIACIPGHTNFEDYPSGLSAEQYYDRLKKDKEEHDKQNGEGEGQGGQGSEGGDSDGDQQGNGQGKGNKFSNTLDDHSMWGQADENKVANEIATERLKKMVQDAVEESVKSGRGWGSVSAKMRGEIIERVKTKAVDWKSVLRYFIKASVNADKHNSMKRINRRYPYIHAGRKTSRTANIAISIDQSGSVSDEMLGAFFEQLNKLAEIATFTVVPFDDRVFEEKVYQWKKGQKHKRERVLCGGTNFDAPTEYVNKHNFDGHIVLTDMYAPKPGRSKCQRMWMTSEQCAQHPYFTTSENVIAIKV